MQFSRRDFIKTAAAVSAGFGGIHAFLNRASADTALATAKGYGGLHADPQGVLDLPEKFSYRVISEAGQRMSDGLFVPGVPDGMAAFPASEGRTLLIRNHELTPSPLRDGPFGWSNELLSQIDPASLYDPGFGETPPLGGTTTLLYNTKTQSVDREFLSLAGTTRNCAGGPTPWNTWISCEEWTRRADGEELERDHGYNFEVPASEEIAIAEPIPLTAMGRMNHEAIAVDPGTGIVYQTEDRHEGLIYRFIPNQRGNLRAGGRLQALVIVDRPSLDTRNWEHVNKDEVYEGGGGEVTDESLASVGKDRVELNQPMGVRWIDLDEVESPEDDLRYRGFDAGAARFARGEGMWYGRESIYFCCTNGGRNQAGQVWRYVPSRFEGQADEDRFPGRLELFLEPNNSELLENGDNITVTPWGDLIVCEDGGGHDRVLGITPAGEVYPIARNAIGEGEFAGSVFSPDGSTLFVNSQAQGITLAITGPWRG